MKNKVENKYAVRTSLTIKAVPERVWAVLADFDNVHTWAPGVKTSHGIGKNELGIGHGRHCEIQGFGGIDEVITQWDSGREMTYSVSSVGPLRDGLSRWHVQDLGDGTSRLDITLSYNLRFGLLGRLMHALMVHQKLASSLPLTAKAVNAQVESQADTAVASLKVKVA